MSATSTIPAFRAALITMIAARFTAQSWNTAVTDGPPPPATLAGTEFAALLETVGQQEVRAMNRVQQPRDERYTQEIELSVRGATRGDQVSLGSRVFALYGEIELGIKADTVLGAYYSGPGHLISVTAGKQQYRTFADDNERESRLNVWLDIHARIS